MARRHPQAPFDPGPIPPLLAAALAGDLAQVQDRLSHGDDPAIQDNEGRSPLYLAAREGFAAVVLALITAGAKFDRLTAMDSDAERLELNGRLSDPAIAKLSLLATGSMSFTIDHGRTMEEHRRRGPYEGWNAHSPLMAAARRGHLGIVEALIAAGAPVDQPGERGRTALSLATRLGQRTVVRTLLAAGAAPALADAHGVSPLAAAVELGLEEIAADLEQAGATLAGKPGAALRGAAKWGDLERVRNLLGAGVPVDAADPNGTTPLALAVMYDNPEVARVLLAAGADMSKGSLLYPALKTAAHFNRVEIMRDFVRGGAVLHKDAMAELLEQAKERKHKEMLKLLDQITVDQAPTIFDAVRAGDHALARRVVLQAAPGAVNWVIFEAVDAGDARMVEILLNAGADANSGDDLGRSLLIAAADSGKRMIVQLVLDHGADVNTENYEDGSTALGGAAEGGHLPIMRMLLAAGAEVTEDDMLRAAGGGSVKAIDLLVKAGGLIDESTLDAASEGGHDAAVARISTLLGKAKIPKAASKRARAAREEAATKLARAAVPGATELFLAAHHGNLDEVRAHLAAGVPVNAQLADNGVSALHAAVREGNEVMVSFLLAAGATLDPRTDQGATPLAEAVLFDIPAMVKLLAEAGADRRVTVNQLEPLRFAASRGYVELAEELIRQGMVGDLDAAAELVQTRRAYLKRVLDAMAGPVNPFTRDLLRPADFMRHLPGVLACLRADAPDDVRSSAAQALGRLGPAASAAVADLETVAQLGSPAVKEAATAALKRIRA